MTERRKTATVLPAEHGTALWAETVKSYLDVAERRKLEDPAGWAEYYTRRHFDSADLRALGRCLDCCQPITLRQYLGVVVSEPCGHWRAHGDLKKIGRFLEERRRKLTPERRASLLELIPSGNNSDGEGLKPSSGNVKGSP